MTKKYTIAKPTCVIDTECFTNYWSIGFKCVDSERKVIIEKFEGQSLDTSRIAKIFRNWRVITFNGIAYDMPMIALAMSGVSNRDLKNASDDIIQGGLKHWEFYDKYDVAVPSYVDHIDTMEVSPGSPTHPSQKMYAGRLHSKTMMELPFHPDEWIREEDYPKMCVYLGTDLDVLHDFYSELKPQIDLRSEMSDQYGVDVRSKSDAQVAEAVIKTEIQRITKRQVYRPKIERGTFKYVPPKWVAFKSNSMKGILDAITSANFYIRHDGVVLAPDNLESVLKKFYIGEMSYKAGIGGLHSQEKKASWFTDETFFLIDRDVTSYYPTIILNAGIYPKHLGEVLLNVYRAVYEKRLDAKRKSQVATDPLEVRRFKDIAETLKIVLNGAFGKLGSPYSILYSPSMMIQVTLNGQLAILMLIEALELAGFQVISANTDGFITRVEREHYAEYWDICGEWELATGFGTEETRYKSLHSRDVNTFVAFPLDGGPYKGKGGFGPSGPGHKGAMGMKKNPDVDVCYEAVIAYLKDGSDIEETIRECQDFKKFVTVTRVVGGAKQFDAEIGKALRYYYSVDFRDVTMHRVDSGNTVPSTNGAKLCLTLPDDMPGDIDIARYVREAYAILQDIGMPALDPTLSIRTGTMLAKAVDQKTFHIVKLPTGKALCERTLKSIRDSWVEETKVPHGERLCKACIQASEALKIEEEVL